MLHKDSLVPFYMCNQQAWDGFYSFMITSGLSILTKREVVELNVSIDWKPWSPLITILMTNTLKISILDQSIVRKNGTASIAIQETIETVKLADKLGYHRFWVSEHHNSTMIAGSSPELLMVKLAGETSTIRIGSGGVMLPNHSALKVAENFRMLEILYPGRIDLGMGRAPGSDRITASVLNPSNSFSEEEYLRQLSHLQAFFRDEAVTQYGPLLAIPQSVGTPEQWILGSSTGGSSLVAAKFGLGLVVARFINGNATPEITQQYRLKFEASEHFKKPACMLAIGVLCAETDEKAAALRKLYDYTILKFEQGRFEPIESFERIADYRFTEEENIRVANNKGRMVSGTPRQVKDELIRLAAEFEVNEIMVTSMTWAQEDRIKSFELIADAFSLKPSKKL